MPPLQIIAAQFVILVLSLSFHEAAHAFTADRLGDPTARRLGRLTLNPLAHIDWIGTVLFPLISMLSRFPLLGWAKPVPVDMRNLRDPRRDFAIVAAAGPASNLLLAGLAAVLFKLLPTPEPVGITGISMYGWLWEACAGTVELNVLLAVFNMIPVPPLDGGNVLMGLVPTRIAIAIGWLRPYGFLILYFLMFSGALFRIISPVRTLLISWLLR